MKKNSNNTLTHSQLRVIALWAQGHEYQEIGNIERITWRTVRSHIANAKSRLGAGTVSQCVTLALAQGLLEIDRNGVVRLPPKEQLLDESGYHTYNR